MKPTFVKLQEHHYNAIPEDYRPRVCADTTGIVAIDEVEGLVAVCIFDSWSYNSCQIHIYIKNPFVLKHGFAEEVFGFVFSPESGREIVIGVTPADNDRALKFIKGIGLKK